MITTQEKQRKAEREKTEFYEHVERDLTESAGSDSTVVCWLREMISKKSMAIR